MSLNLLVCALYSREDLEEARIRHLLLALEEEGQVDVHNAHIRSYWEEQEQIEKVSTAPAPASTPDRDPERANKPAAGNSDDD
jgi:hypothetical protein